MNDLTVFVVPALLMLDHYLTLATETLRRRVDPSGAVNELNPIWLDSVARLRWIDWKHHLGVILVTGILWFLQRHGPSDVMEYLLGCLLTVLAATGVARATGATARRLGTVVLAS